MAAVPAARPSMLSSRLKLFMLATRIRQASGMPAQRGSQSGRTPAIAAKTAIASCPPNFFGTPMRATSSQSPSANAAPVPAMSGR